MEASPQPTDGVTALEPRQIARLRDVANQMHDGRAPAATPGAVSAVVGAGGQVIPPLQVDDSVTPASTSRVRERTHPCALRPVLPRRDGLVAMTSSAGTKKTPSVQTDTSYRGKRSRYLPPLEVKLDVSQGPGGRSLIPCVTCPTRGPMGGPSVRFTVGPVMVHRSAGEAFGSRPTA